ncbi:hypothetical protein CQW23_10530 [Capsicum baccatum]|uniref:Uncharacterized protein n=1 Tax=Capsicum baccatum TaxID=33114 RepID=A0A2G2WZZ1_CAPBA|nr:hypothetical protein CQW23_10530 [Capsicum baccatum]
MKGGDMVQISEDYTLLDLVQVSLNSTHVVVGVLLRLRKELSFVKDMPVLIAIDQVTDQAMVCAFVQNFRTSLIV